MRYTPRFTTGPFLSASCIIEDAALSFYFYYLLKETVEKQMQTGRPRQRGSPHRPRGGWPHRIRDAAGDKELIKECEADLALLDSAYQLSILTEKNDTIQ